MIGKFTSLSLHVFLLQGNFGLMIGVTDFEYYTGLSSIFLNFLLQIDFLNFLNLILVY